MHFAGAPAGYEVPILVNAIIDVSRGETSLAAGTVKVLAELRNPVTLRMLVSATCASCGADARLALQMAIASPHVDAWVLDAAQVPRLARRIGGTSLPSALINDICWVPGASARAGPSRTGAVRRHVTLPLVIDTDPGIDDALALILAARAPAARLRAVSVSYGNTTLDRATRNARLVLARDQCAVPGLPGRRPPARPAARHRQGNPRSGRTRRPRHSAARARHPDRHEHSRRASGPRRARHARHAGPPDQPGAGAPRRPGLPALARGEHVAMGGNIAAAGNSGGLAEFNVWCDPEAAAEVFAARLGTELVGLDVTRRLVITAPGVERLASHHRPGRPVARPAARLLRPLPPPRRGPARAR